MTVTTLPALSGAVPTEQQYIRFARLCAEASGSGPAAAAASAAETAAGVTPCTVALWADVAAEIAATNKPGIDLKALARRAMEGANS